MEESSTSPNFLGVTDLKKTSMASSRDYLAHKRKVRKDSPLRRGSDLCLSFRRGAQDMKDYRQRIKVNNVLESRPDMPEVFRITNLPPQTKEETEEGKTRNCLRNNTKYEGKEKEEGKIERKGERLPSTDSQDLKTRTKTSIVTKENQVSKTITNKHEQHIHERKQVVIFYL